MKIHAIETGLVSVKSRQRKGVGSVGRRINTLLDKTWTEWLPIYCWVIEHPEGIIVIDTGETARTSNPSHFPKWHPYFRLGVQMQVEPEQEVGPQIKKLGLSLNDVRWVIMTHLHTDHAGGLSHFPESEFLISRQEYALSLGLKGKIRGYLPNYFPKWFEPRIVGYTVGEYGAFRMGYTLTKAEDVLVVPTPGHTPGHQSVILRDGNITYLFAGDTSYNEQLMIDRSVDGVSPNTNLAGQTIDRIHRFISVEPTVYLPSHDPMSKERMMQRIPTMIS
ncbi:N-acyl homoserine lactonase family protein [Alicyclobacillus sp. SO9]|uniref:N-acyl homoserine lactonase family protein n=1 Tax=Alicyclobacillus sp. SO9 TaxID=2665646 RepID=UPI0018E7FC23|nr:N-acyl homoserine lactonase family protein [Alicyclobacillus sp. SO9]QQE80405.1 N-acyl homoserine lactonase family protein [Alicyclobacillus sp. SO9]